jgi:hypothetical protein
MDTGRNLLFGVLALQADLLSGDGFGPDGRLWAAAGPLALAYQLPEGKEVARWDNSFSETRPGPEGRLAAPLGGRPDVEERGATGPPEQHVGRPYATAGDARPSRAARPAWRWRRRWPTSGCGWCSATTTG